jgi:GH35 family endo-1,4-beta-xylanase
VKFARQHGQVVRAHPAVAQPEPIWGFTDRYSWVPVCFPAEGAATVMWDDFTPRPACFALRDTLLAARRNR